MKREMVHNFLLVFVNVVTGMFTVWIYCFGYLVYKEERIAQERPLGGVKRSQDAQIIDRR